MISAWCARTGTRPGTAESSKREHGRVLPCPKHIHKRLAHEEPDGDADRDRYHGTPDINPVPGCSYRSPTRLRKTRL